MPEAFLDQPPQEQALIYRALAPRLARSPVVLEKDVWVCWVLQTLFSLPGSSSMAFKGGTSLSKVFGAIARFSEDVDITLDFRSLDGSWDPFAKGASRSRLKKFSEGLRSLVRAQVQTVVAPHFRAAVADAFDGDTVKLEIDEEGEQLRVHYASALEDPGDYLGHSVLVEFGGRNITDPKAVHDVAPDIAPLVDALEFPRARVNVLSPARTFWEKATLIHVECQRAALRATVARLSRHWYDLAQLADQVHGKAAISDRALLADVVRHKKVFYDTSHANYDACLSGQLRLIPQDSALTALKEDFHRMVSAGMFIGEPPDFETIIERLRALEDAINRRGER